MKSYDDEYKKSEGLFWETTPAKFVQIFVEKNILELKGCKILDMGAGEGKNALFLARNGALVDAVDISKEALNRIERLPDYKIYESQINLINHDIITFKTKVVYNLVICYGLIHALQNKEEVLLVIDKLKDWTNKGGYIIIATFNNLLPPPEVQQYLKIDAFMNKGELKLLFDDWEIIEHEENIITETHNTSNVEHQHSITRLIARKNV